MHAATLNLKVTPRRIISRAEAAQYCGLPLKQFEMVCPCQPVVLAAGRTGWDLADLDRWIDSVKDQRTSDTEALLERLGQ
jgi:predicted DNA-binding transcriptional regulator AlpA